MQLVAATRGSQLALLQTDEIISALQNVMDVTIKKRIVKAKGDKFAEIPLHKIGGKGLFVREVDKAILTGKAHFAVHSLKDLPTQIHPNIVLATIPPRKTPYDVLVSKNKETLDDLPAEAIVGTGSLRRKAQLLSQRRDLQLRPIRGNVDTRVGKVLSHDYDATVLAEVGLERLNLTHHIAERLDPDIFVPSPGQGALAVTARKDAASILKALKQIDHKETRQAVLAEKKFIEVLGGGCKVPIGAFARVKQTKLQLRGTLLTLNGEKRLDGTEKGSINEAIEIGTALAHRFQEIGANEILQQLREQIG